jgi:hypothetical protein
MYPQKLRPDCGAGRPNHKFSQHQFPEYSGKSKSTKKSCRIGIFSAKIKKRLKSDFLSVVTIPDTLVKQI